MVRPRAIHTHALGLCVLFALSAFTQAPSGDAPRTTPETERVTQDVHLLQRVDPRIAPPSEFHVRILSPSTGNTYSRASERSITLSGVASPPLPDSMAVYSWYYDLRARGVERRTYLGSGATLDWYPGTMGPCTERGSYDVTLRLEALSVGPARDASLFPPFQSGFAELSVHLDCDVTRARRTPR